MKTKWPAALLAVVLGVAPARAAPLPAANAPMSRPPALTGLVSRIAADVAARRASIDKAGTPPGAMPHASPSLDITYLALAAVQLEKARDYLEQTPRADIAARQALAAASRLLTVANPTRPASILLPDRTLEQAYFARDDGSPQPYFVFIPSATPTNRLPLLVFLHGWVPDTSRTNPWTILPDILDLAERHGVLVVAPHGRTNTDFQFVGEVDVLRVIEEMKAFYPVDPDRVYLTGVSMGGAGAWQVACHYPDGFAAVAPISAQTDWFRFWHEFFNYPVRAQLPKHVAWFLAAHTPVELAGNLTSLYSYSRQSTSCFLGIQHGRDMAAALKRVGAPYTFHEDPSLYGHHIYFLRQCWTDVFRHLLEHRRAATPTRVSYRTYSLRFPGAYWAEILAFDAWGHPASVDARVETNGNVTVTTENVARLRLTPPPTPGTTDHVARMVTWNGAAVPDCPPDRAGNIMLSRPGAKPPPPVGAFPGQKGRALCGPASDVFNFPFAVVRGTRGTDEQDAECAQMAAKFARDWDDYAEARLTILRDVDVTEAIMRERGLVLFGLPETNELIARMAPKLPFRLTGSRVSLPDGQQFSLAGNGLVLCYPNPLAPDRYVLICNGVPWGQARGNNHRFDLLPDFVIYTPDALPGMSINRYLAAGLFDADWHYSPALTDFGDATVTDAYPREALDAP